MAQYKSSGIRTRLPVGEENGVNLGLDETALQLQLFSSTGSLRSLSRDTYSGRDRVFKLFDTWCGGSP